MRIGIMFGARPGETGAAIDGLLARFRQYEADGFPSAWVANIFGHDALTLLALAGRETSRIELGTAVVPTYPRHPVALAQQALTVQAATGGRLALGIGLSHRVVIEDMFGLDWSKPIRHTREYLTVLNGLLTQQPTEFSGEEYRVRAQFKVDGVGTPPPVLVAALGPHMLKLCGQLAAGTITWMGGAKYLAETAVPILNRAAAEAGRPAPRVVASLPVAVTEQREAARAAASRIFANYGRLPSYRAVLDAGGAPDPADVAIIGDETEVRRQLDHLARIGVTDFVAAPYPVREDRPAYDRTYALMAELASARGE